ncbi:MBL fold metallo-hydrolase [Lentilitoribacter sp. Alg239-R112]|uniref:MBL fold metallo-hydrolase n=1 Tax=Lentilitoribacter sp. Alg239-R112 TaxID=2305987 RepID=UPI0013A6D9A3|nr:MBL fold metallo-hydrolase [Lentilitoribacter sp. Alg239-R112]
MSLTNFTRRQVLQTGVAATAAALIPMRNLQAKMILQSGGKNISSLSDGNLSLPVSFLFPDIDKSELDPFLAKHGMNNKALEPKCNLTYVEDGDRKILFDAGAGSNFMPSAGKLMESFDAAGIDVSEVTDVIFTHGHPDHLWGILDDFDEITFPEANLYFPQVEWDFWTSEDVIQQMSDGREIFAVGAQNRLDVMKERVQLFNSGDEVISGVEAFDTSGHTPGHMAFVIHGASDDESLMVIGDAITNDIVSFAKPSWPSGSDHDSERGIETRVRLLDRLAQEKMQLIGYHLPNGGLGRVEKSGNAYKFVQV